MNTIEQAMTLKEVVPRLVRDVADLQLRVEKLERERANTPDWIRIGHTGCSWDWQCPVCHQTRRDGHADDCIHVGRDETFIGSIDGLDDVALRVQILSPDELARAKLQRAGKATRTPEPEWSGYSGVD